MVKKPPHFSRRYHMAIRYNKNLNEKVRNAVRNYNARISRMEKRGVSRLPQKIMVSELKSRYNTRAELDRELSRISTLGRKNVIKSVTTSGGAKVADWQYTYAKTNRKSAKEYFEKEYARLNKRTARFPGERMLLDNASAKINLLSRPLDSLNQQQFRSIVATINEFATSTQQLKNSYRGFLSEVEWVMNMVGIDEETKETFFKKFKTLSPEQFLYAYDNNDIINRIYQLYQKDYGEEEARLNVGNEEAENLINMLMEQADVMIEEAKLNAD